MVVVLITAILHFILIAATILTRLLRACRSATMRHLRTPMRWMCWNKSNNSCRISKFSSNNNNSNSSNNSSRTINNTSTMRKRSTWMKREAMVMMTSIDTSISHLTKGEMLRLVAMGKTINNNNNWTTTLVKKTTTMKTMKDIPTTWIVTQGTRQNGQVDQRVKRNTSNAGTEIYSRILGIFSENLCRFTVISRRKP